MIKKYGLRILLLPRRWVAAARVASVQLGVIVMRWQDNMTETPAGDAGRARLRHAGGQRCRATGSELVYAKEQRRRRRADRTRCQPAPSRSRRARGLHDLLHALPRASGQGRRAGDRHVRARGGPHQSRSATRRGPTATGSSHVSVGGALMPAYGGGARRPRSAGTSSTTSAPWPRNERDHDDRDRLSKGLHSALASWRCSRGAFVHGITRGREPRVGDLPRQPRCSGRAWPSWDPRWPAMMQLTEARWSPR